MVVSDQTDSMFAGNPRTLRFTITDEDVDGSPAMDLTGMTSKFTLTKFNSEGEPITSSPLFQKTSAVAEEIIHTDEDQGELEVYLDSVDTQNLIPADYYFELEVFNGDGDGVVVATGTETIKPNVKNT